MAKKLDKKTQRHVRARQEMAARSSRYMLLRYGSAVLFFADLFWAFLLGSYKSPFVLIPLALVVGGVLAAIELTAVLDGTRTHLGTMRYYVEISGACVLLLALVLPLSGTSWLFPFVASSPVAFCMCLVTLVLRVWMLVRLGQIETFSDKKYQRYRRFL